MKIASPADVDDTATEIEIAALPANTIIETAMRLLAKDDGYADKNKQLETENCALRHQVERLKKTLAALIDIA